MDQEVVKLKTKMQKTLDKIYMPSQDQIVEGLSNFNEMEANMLRGQQQNLEITHTVQKAVTPAFHDSGDMNIGGSSGINAVSSGFQAQETILVDQNQWAQEVRKADERCEQYQVMLTNLQSTLQDE